MIKNHGHDPQRIHQFIRASIMGQRHKREGNREGKRDATRSPHGRVTNILTDAAIKGFAPRDTPYKKTDGEGLYLLIQPTGAKWWRFNYRRLGKFRTISMGTYPEVPLAKARERRAEARRQVADGKDPSALRRSAKEAAMQDAACVFRDVAKQWMFKQRLAPRTRKKNTYLLHTYVYPKIGTTPMNAVTSAQVLALLAPIEAAGHIETMHRTKQIIGQIARFAVATGRATTDPTAALARALTPVTPTSYAAITDPRDFGALLRAIDAFRGSVGVRLALKLAPLVLLRPGELRAVEWTEIDFDAALCRIPGRRMKMRRDHLVPLSRQSIAILREAAYWTGNGRYVFSTLRTASRPISPNALGSAIAAIGFDGRMTPHGFRASARTLIDEVLRVPPDVIEVQLAHTVSGPLGATYNRAQYLEQRTAMMQAWADYLDTLKATP